MTKTNTLKVGTTFSGIGAPEQALKQLKIPFICKWACDIDKDAKITYLANHQCERFYDDITKIDLNNLEYVDLYCFGFPCQDVSFFGKRNLSKGKTILVEYSLDIIDKIKPKYILFENVKGLLSKKFEVFFESILSRLRENYNIDYKVFNSKYWGVAQNRERVFCLGIRKDLPEIKLPLQDKSNFTHIDTILECDPLNKYTLNDKRWASIQGHKKRNQLKGNGFGYRMIKDTAYTLLTTYYDLPSHFISQKDKNPRLLTERECARLHGFVDSFILSDDPHVAYKQLGNTITVNVLVAIFKQLFIQ